MAWIGAWGTWGSWIAHQALVEDMVEEYLRLGVRSQESGEDMVEEHLGSGVRPATPFVIHYRASHISLWIYVPRLAKKRLFCAAKFVGGICAQNSNKTTKNAKLFLKFV